MRTTELEEGQLGEADPDGKEQSLAANGWQGGQARPRQAWQRDPRRYDVAPADMAGDEGANQRSSPASRPGQDENSGR